MFVLESQGYMCQANIFYLLAKLQGEKRKRKNFKYILFSYFGVTMRAVLIYNFSDTLRQLVHKVTTKSISHHHRTAGLDPVM